MARLEDGVIVMRLSFHATGTIGGMSPTSPRETISHTVPAAIDRAESLLAWFDAEGRDWPWRQTRDRWRILVSEVCLQQTQVERAAAKIALLLDAYPSVDAMADAPLGEVLAHWQGLGYPRRARNLHLAARHVVEHGWPQPARYADLPGVGPYTAAALQCCTCARCGGATNRKKRLALAAAVPIPMKFKGLPHVCCCQNLLQCPLC